MTRMANYRSSQHSAVSSNLSFIDRRRLTCSRFRWYSRCRCRRGININNSYILELHLHEHNISSCKQEDKSFVAVETGQIRSRQTLRRPPQSIYDSDPGSLPQGARTKGLFGVFNVGKEVKEACILPIGFLVGDRFLAQHSIPVVEAASCSCMECTVFPYVGSLYYRSPRHQPYDVILQGRYKHPFLIFSIISCIEIGVSDY